MKMKMIMRMDFNTNLTCLLCLLMVNLLSAQNPSEELKKAESILLQNPEEARKAVLEISKKKLNEEDKLKALFLLTNTSNFTGRLTDAIHFGNEALILAEKKNDVLTEVKLYGLLGNLYQSIPLNEKTKEYLNLAENLINRKKLPDSLSYIKGNIYYLKGMNYANTLDCDMAVNYFNKAINVYRSTQYPLSKINLKLAYLNKGFCFIETKRIKEADANLALALVKPVTNSESLDFYPVDFVKQQNIYVEFGLARIMALEGNISGSNNSLENILQQGKNINIESIRLDIYKILSDNYLDIGDLAKSKDFENHYLTELTKNKKNQEELLNTLIESEQKIEKENNEGIVKRYFIFGMIITLFGVIFLVILIKKNRKIQTEYKNLKKQITN